MIFSWQSSVGSLQSSVFSLQSSVFSLQSSVGSLQLVWVWAWVRGVTMVTMTVLMKQDKLISLILAVMVLLLITPSVLNSQSIHQHEYELHLSGQKQPSLFPPDLEIIKFNYLKSSNTSKTVFGYLPYWEYPEARNYLHYDLLTHIALFDFSVSANGNISTPGYWPWTDVINQAHSNGVKLIMTAVNFNTNEIHTIISNEAVRLNFFENAVKLIKQYDLQGINVDFEGLDIADRGERLNNFMLDLTSYVHREIPGSEISFAAPPVNWGGWDYNGLASACDYLFIMGYNFYGSWSERSGPGAPLTGGTYNITTTLEKQYEDVLYNTPGKLILGVPYYGNRWNTAGSLPYSRVIEHIGHPRYYSAYEEGLVEGLKWDNISKTPWYHYSDGGKHYQVWFENDSSLGLKYDLADKHNLGGIGMWALGYDRHREELWNEIRKRYSTTSVVDQEITSGENIIEIFPNPVTDYGNIRINIVEGSEFQLCLLNALGREINVIAEGLSSGGAEIIDWSFDGLASGLYYIVFNASIFSVDSFEIKKVLVLK